MQKLLQALFTPGWVHNGAFKSVSGGFLRPLPETSVGDVDTRAITTVNMIRIEVFILFLNILLLLLFT